MPDFVGSEAHWQLLPGSCPSITMLSLGSLLSQAALLADAVWGDERRMSPVATPFGRWMSVPRG